MVVEVVGYVLVVGIPGDRLVRVPDVGVPGRRKGEERPLVVSCEVVGVVIVVLAYVAVVGNPDGLVEVLGYWGAVCSSVLIGDCVVVPSMDENIISMVELDVGALEDKDVITLVVEMTYSFSVPPTSLVVYV